MSTNLSTREISITVGQLMDHRSIDVLLGMMSTTSRAELYDSLREYLHYTLAKKSKDFNPAIIDFLMNKTRINPQDQSRISEVLSLFIRVARELLNLAAMYVRGAVGIKLVDYRISHIDDYRRDAIVLEVVYA